MLIAVLPQDAPKTKAQPKAKTGTAAKASPADTAWTDIRKLTIEGQGWPESQLKAPFDRLPAKAEGVVRPSVWGLGRNSAGIAVRFASDSNRIEARWTLNSKNLALPHMPATGVSGVDLYVKGETGRWHWVGCGFPYEQTNTATLVSGLPRGRHEFLMYLPLYNGVSKVEVGVPPGSKVEKAEPRAADRSRPVVFYGTSITQGGCASRPGMVHTAIIGRALNVPVINLGFSGSGRLDPELAPLLGEIDASVYVLDCLPNLNGKETAERAEPFVKALRKLKPDTPILLVEDRYYTNGSVLAGPKKHNDDNHAALRAAYKSLKDAGVPKLFYLEGKDQLGDDGEGTVDSSHPTDLGFHRMADVFGAELVKILGKK